MVAETITKILDKLPLATLQAIAGFVLVIIAYCNGDVTVLQAFAALGLNGVGAGAVGHVRNGAGKGVKKTP